MAMQGGKRTAMITERFALLTSGSVLSAPSPHPRPGKSMAGDLQP